MVLVLVVGVPKGFFPSAPYPMPSFRRDETLRGVSGLTQRGPPRPNCQLLGEARCREAGHFRPVMPTRAGPREPVSAAGRVATQAVS